jgi:prepilin-type N-terminal cleavage/methylation domain-containing protein
LKPAPIPVLIFNLINELIYMKKGFTLIELLIVIAILAVLATVVVLVLNPAQLLAESRDGKRVSDISAVRDAIVFYLARKGASDPGLGTADYCTSSSTCGAGNPFIAAGTVRTVYAIDGTGWVPLNFGLAALGGSPLGSLPRDPTNDGTFFYAYGAGSPTDTFEVNAKMESTKYLAADGPAATDGGSVAAWFEVGTGLSQ